jgi:glycerol-3-phosphate dehydrogenase
LVHTKETDDVAVGFDELTNFVQEVNTSYPELCLRADNITMVLSGLTLFGENKPGQKDLRFAHRSRLIDHKKEHGIDGLVTLIGVRATMARGMAENTINLVLRKLGFHSRPSSTDHVPLQGGSIDRFEDFFREALCRHNQTYSAEVIRNLVHNYGTEYTEILRLADGDQAMAQGLGESNTLKAQVVYAIRDEMALSLSDVVFRRTDLGTGGHPGQAAIDQCAQILANEFAWDKDRQEREIDEVLERFPSIQEFTE